MYKEVRRKDRAITQEEARAVLEKCEYGVLAMASEEHGAYAIPLSYTVAGDVIYFHCAPTGEKVDCINANPNVCFTVIGSTQPVYDGGFSTYYECCVVFGKMRAVSDEKEKHDALMELARRYLPDHMEKAEGDIAKSWTRTAVYALDVERITGKAKKRKA